MLRAVSSSLTYKRWRVMKRRCYDTRFISYPNYGAKGIKVCDRWKNSFFDYLSDIGECPGAEYVIDRIDPVKDYEPGNCRWIRKKDSNENRRQTQWVSIDGQNTSFRKAARILGVNYDRAYYRYRFMKMSAEEALEMVPVRKIEPWKNRNRDVTGKFK